MKAVVFDMDGLIFNTEDVYTLVGTELLRRRGHEFTPELKNEMMGLIPQTSFEIMIRRCNLPNPGGNWRPNRMSSSSGYWTSIWPPCRA